MNRRFGITLLAQFVPTVGDWTAASAYEGHNHKVLGTVTMAASDHVMLKNKDGEVTVHITKDTKVLRSSAGDEARGHQDRDARLDRGRDLEGEDDGHDDRTRRGTATK